MNIRRAKTVYVKELIDILRDRRTLIAMVLVPIVLYPLLMLGGIQAVSTQFVDAGDEKIIIGFERKSEWDDVLSRILVEERFVLTRQRATAIARDAPRSELEGIPLPLADRLDPRLTPDLRTAIRRRTVQCGIVVDHVERFGTLTERVSVRILYQPEAVYSEAAAHRLREALERVAEARVINRLARLDVDIRTIEPITIAEDHLTTSGSILGLVLPLILVLMTITGAIYPALDLTAGERERGTLESLMVCPVPTIDLVVGKFLVVTTIAIIGAGLNLASVTATVYFGGFDEAIGGGDEGGFPFRVLPVVLLSLVPFAVFMSAIMIAVGSCARTFKEAQNYIAPVILAVLIPGGIAALPAAKLTGIMSVTPVANMVLLTRELLSGASVAPTAFFWVLLSTSMYAAVAVAIAVHMFGRESVVFADSVSLGALFRRRLFKPSLYPSLAASGLYAAALFPAWFYVQGSLQMAGGDDASSVIFGSAMLMPVLFVVVPLVVLRYWKIGVGATMVAHMPRVRHVVAAVAIGLTAWVPAHELFIFQNTYIGAPPALEEMNKAIHAALESMPLMTAILVIAIVPAICEELFFRGFLLSGLRTSFRPWPAIVWSACVFGAFHFLIFKFAMTACLGILLGWLCWRSRSIWPGVLAHALHNGVTLVGTLEPAWQRRLGIEGDDPWAHLPPTVIVVAGALFLFGVVLVATSGRGSPLAARQAAHSPTS